MNDLEKESQGSESVPGGEKSFTMKFRAALNDYAIRYAPRRVALIAAAALVGWTGGWHWIPELFSHAFFQYAIALLFLTLLLFHARHWRWAALSLVATILVWLPIAPSWLPAPTVAEAIPPKNRLTLLQFNALRKTEPLTQWLASYAKDIDAVLLLEADAHFENVIKTFSAEFPYHIERFSDGAFGIALISRHPFVKARFLDDIDSIFPAIDAVLSTPAGPLRLVGIHPPPPTRKIGAQIRDEFLESLAKYLKPDTPTVVFGDFNATPWSPKLRAFLAQTGLEDAQRGHGTLSTWPAPFAGYADFLGVPIDLTLVSPSLTVETREAGPNLQSDHLPVITRIVLPVQGSGIR
ncbi:MAG: endonuclease/exonuclease/phosphatase family protein [Candidatus Accumulibacter sp.]|jgi:endonuclease/exonuclease/phosphatase (EEP) superfamily protein YafD|nr:endonuclease/exonuclease/phosphatase family protein [Accumulibacter sp.]